MKRKATEIEIPFATEAKTIAQIGTGQIDKLVDSSETKILQECLSGVEVYTNLFGSCLPPLEPNRKPRFIRDITGPAPVHTKTAAANFLLTAFATYAHDVNFLYNDKSKKELRMNSFVVGDNGIGKSIVKRMLDVVLLYISQEDDEGWKIDKQYRQKKEAAGDRKTEVRPKVQIRIINPNITKPELNQLGDESDGKPFFMHVQEPDELDILKGGKNGRQHFEILKKADDEKNTAGQMRVGVKSVSAKYNLRLNYIIEIRPEQLLSFFYGEIINGARDRASLCQIYPLEDKHSWPKIGDLGERYQAKIKPYIDNIAAAKGTIECKRAIKLIDNIRNEFFEYYDDTQDDILEVITHRALCRAFKRACLIYIAEGQKWDSALNTWIRWSFMYDMWMQFHYFYDAIQIAKGDLKVTTKGPVSLRSMLPEEFTFEQLKQVYIKIGLGDDETKMHGTIRSWIKRGSIVRTDTGYRKTK